jgi:hypothetical protein
MATMLLNENISRKVMEEGMRASGLKNVVGLVK